MPRNSISWAELLPKFATHIDHASERAKMLSFDDSQLEISFNPNILGDNCYRTDLISRVREWRGGLDRSTIYVFSYSELAPQDLITSLRNCADASLKTIGRARAFPRCNNHNEGSCLYVGHSYQIESRFKDHLGFGAASTSSLHLNHWEGHPHDEVIFSGRRLSSPDKLLAQLLEEYLWDELRPLLGKRSGK